MSIQCQMSDGSQQSLQDLCQGYAAVVLYFYPKDMTSGCTLQAEALRDAQDWFNERNIRIVGVSRDSVKKHQRFVEKYRLPFDLVADTDEQLCQKFGVMAEKSMFGKRYMGIVRSTFLLDANAEILQEWRQVKIDQHLSALQSYIGEMKHE
ncbi:peroxiredoxin [Candidatus Synchoanobacter obligatus]|uniref:thioredoxin-dependent peroxiredoxin n=1 Tax=Candidatus Synchoanobacter obligatus TaxID=2919597 RepID=A0ABT1L733_9GAMM|nr:peroxiredoxin [Candidatus Synchoanobacter obligatus]MCP8352628.1 peroxiredoxin [Candidatus Synchoanobacter obligatus]